MRALLELSRGRGPGRHASDAVRSVSGGHSLNGTLLRNLLLASVTGVVIVVDQITKLYIMQTMRPHESIPVVPNLFSLTYIRNPGAAFGLLAGSSNAFRMVFFGLTSIIALGLLSTILLRMPERDWMGRLSVAGILGGAIGNLIDRLRYGEVIDFLDVFVENYHWPAFNVADSAITVGVIFLIIHFAFDKKEDPPVAPETSITP
ncbi:MAG: signal peptidase II [Nitrospira sp.]|nr:MAG: signal peptidase II [Nitrospira sp.]